MGLLIDNFAGGGMKALTSVAEMSEERDQGVVRLEGMIERVDRRETIIITHCGARGMQQQVSCLFYYPSQGSAIQDTPKCANFNAIDGRCMRKLEVLQRENS